MIFPGWFHLQQTQPPHHMDHHPHHNCAVDEDPSNDGPKLPGRYFFFGHLKKIMAVFQDGHQVELVPYILHILYGIFIHTCITNLSRKCKVNIPVP